MGKSPAASLAWSRLFRFLVRMERPGLRRHMADTPLGGPSLTQRLPRRFGRTRLCRPVDLFRGICNLFSASATLCPSKQDLSRVVPCIVFFLLHAVQLI